MSATPPGLRAPLVLLLIAVPVLGCGGPPRARTTFLRSADLVEMTDDMARSFAADPAIGTRGRNDAAWIISVSRVVNRTNQIIPEREKWLYLGRLRALLAQGDGSARHRLIWIVPPERWPIVAEALGVSEEPYGLRLDPTHLLASEFLAITSTSGRGRRDAYLCSFQLIDLASGAIVWEDRWEVTRTVEGVTYD